jgi:hypothetical protein
MPAPTLIVGNTTLIVDVIPGRRYAYSLIGGDWNNAEINVRQVSGDQWLVLAEHTQDGGNEIVATTDTITIALSGTPADPITIHLHEITGK